MTPLLAVAITLSILMAPIEAIASDKVYITIGLSQRVLTTYIPFICENTPIVCASETQNGKISDIVDGIIQFLTRGEYDSIKTFGGTVEVTP